MAREGHAEGRNAVNKKPSYPNVPLKGVGGWLLLLIFVLAIYTPVMGFRSLYYDFIVSASVFPVLETNPMWVRYRMAVWIVFGILCLFCFGAGYALWKIHKPISVQFAIGVIWLAGPFVPIIYAAIAAAIFPIAFSQAIKPFYLGIAATAIQSAIWTGYLVKSVRVKNTYYPGN